LFKLLQALIVIVFLEVGVDTSSVLCTIYVVCSRLRHLRLRLRT